MTLDKALYLLSATKTLCTVIREISEGDLSGFKTNNKISVTVNQVNEKIALYSNQLKECENGYEQWGILSDLHYWEAVKNILAAVEIVGPDNLPDVNPPCKNGLAVMDLIFETAKFGESILNAAKQ